MVERTFIPARVLQLHDPKTKTLTLQEDPESKHSSPQGMKSNRRVPEVDQNVCCTLLTLTNRENCPFDPTNYSSRLKLRQIVALVNRFIENCKRDAAIRMTDELTANELKRSGVQLVRQAQ